MRGHERTRRIGLASVLVLVLFVMYPMLLWAPMFLKMGDIKGEATDDRHQGWIETGEVLWGQSMPEDESKAAGQTGVDRAIPGQVTVTKRVDRASPQLAEIKAKGGYVPVAVLDVPRKDGKPGRVITTMTNVQIVALTPSADGRSEKVKLAYRVYRVDFTSR
jgi:type VI secretion system secreted protein Hcp